MNKECYIQSYCTIQNNTIALDGKIIFKSEDTEFADFAKAGFRHFNIGYPKFYKMDNMSKLAFLSAELLLNKEMNHIKENNTALIFSNKSSSLDTDVKFQGAISDKDNFFPSPAVFVYTLPNICMGEISIRHQLKSENCFFIFESFNPELLHNYASVLLNTHKADKVLCGWVEYFNEEYKAFLYLVAEDGWIKHDKQTIEQLYNQ